MSKVIERFLRYVSMDTQSEEEQETIPSTKKQRRLAEMLAEELRVSRDSFVFGIYRAYGHLTGCPRKGCESSDDYPI